MRAFLALFFCIAFLPHSFSQIVLKEKEIDLSNYFSDYSAGTFVLDDLNKNERLVFNKDQAEKPLSPCSTFKIPNTLIGLETGVLKDENHFMEWDGAEYSVKSWNGDHTLKSAMENSVVWYYQRVASAVGEERMQDYVDKIGYGNRDISGGITKFWLGSTLKISALEQVGFITRLYKNDLPFSQRSIDIVKALTVYKQGDGYTLRGKTGSGFVEGERTWGWYVGYLTKGDDAYVFAANIEAKSGASGMKARDIVVRILDGMGFMQ